MDVNPPYRLAPPLPADLFAELRQQAIFTCFKWDPQVGDEAVLSPQPLVISADTWRTLADLAEQLSGETLRAEAELRERPELHHQLGLSGPIRRALRAGLTGGGPAGPQVRVMRFDFHFTPEGWRISEVNSDVPGGYNEADGFTALMARHYTDLRQPAHVGLQLARAIAQAGPPDLPVALVHATAYSDDRQVMEFLARALAEQGRASEFVAPDHIRWSEGRAFLHTTWSQREVGVLARFFPAEWLPALPRRSNWKSYFSAGPTPQTNPATAILTQSKRFPLVWPRLATPLPTWQRLLPTTVEPRAARLDDGDTWILKPTLGRIGEGIAMRGLNRPEDWSRAQRSARWWPRHWVAQQRFQTLPVQAGDTAWYPCLGMYTVNGTAAGLYGRMARRPLIDSRARDVAVLVEPNLAIGKVAA